MIELLESLKHFLDEATGAGGLLEGIEGVDLFMLTGEKYPRILVRPGAETPAGTPIYAGYRRMHQTATVSVCVLMQDKRTQVAAESAMAWQRKIERVLFYDPQLVWSEYASGLIAPPSGLTLNRIDYGTDTATEEGLTGAKIYFAMMEVAAEVIYRNGAVEVN